MNNKFRKSVAYFLVFALTITSFIFNKPSNADAASKSSSCAAIFRVLKAGVTRPDSSTKISSSNYNVIGAGRIVSGSAYGDVSSKIVTYPDLSSIEVHDFEQLEWYSISKDFLLWKVDAQIVTKPEGTVINAEYRIINDGVAQSEKGSFAKAGDYTLMGTGKVKLATDYGSEVYKDVVSSPDCSDITKDGSKIYWYTIGQDDDTWVIEGLVIKAANPVSATATTTKTTETELKENDTTASSDTDALANLSVETTSSANETVTTDVSAENELSADSTASTASTDSSLSKSIDVAPFDYDAAIEDDSTASDEEALPEGVINIKDEGAMGDGVTDDSDVINKVLNSGATKVYFPAGNYKCTKRLEINKIDNLTIYGHGDDSVIMTGSDYTGGDNATENFFTLWECNNISFEKICFKANETWTVAYSRQVACYYVSNISFENCSFIVPSTVKQDGPNTDREYTNLCFYTGWHDITVNNCYFEQLGAVERGSNIILTDIWNAGCDNAAITNNKFYHNAHDEMFSLFGGKEDSSSMKHINVSGNEFNALYSDEVSSRTMCFTFAYTDSKNVADVVFTDNVINATTPGSLMTFGVIDGCEVSNNKINITNNSYYNNGIVFSGTTSVDVKNNNITIDGTDENGMAIVACGNMLFENNNLTINKSMRYVFSEATILNNTITLNAYAESIAQAPKLMEGNIVTMNDKVDNFISYIQIALSFESVTRNNTFNYNYDDNADAVSYLTGNAVYVNIGTTLNNNKVIFSDNTISAPNVNSFRKNLLAYCVSDEAAQTFVISGNDSPVYKDFVYLCQGSVANIITE